MKKTIIAILLIAVAGTTLAKIDLATLPTRDTVQLTIYNSADLTLARESRQLTLKHGENKLQFSWAGTLIDPTSLDMIPKANAGKIDIAELTFPPRVKNLGLWNINSEVTGKVPMEISYLTSGLTWRAFYMGTLSKDEKTMQLAGYVRVTNNSGEDYENAQTRLIVGKVHILDQIAELARRQYPYGRPGVIAPMVGSSDSRTIRKLRAEFEDGLRLSAALTAAPKEIKKEGLSEYFLYTIEGTETIPNNWSKRLPSFDVDNIPVVNLYKYEETRYGKGVVRFISFANDEKHQLGETPIPGGAMKVYRDLDENQHLSYEGQSSFKYIPVDEDVELNLGQVANVVVTPTLMNFETENYKIREDRITGWDEIRTYKIEAKNTRDIPVKIEITRNFNTNSWELETDEKYEDIDSNTVRFTMTLKPRTDRQFEYTLTTYHGTNQ